LNKLVLCLVALSLFSGCVVSGSKSSSNDDSESSSVNIGPLIGLLGMAVDGDDKDDHEHFFDDNDDCRCRDKGGLRLSFE